MEDLCGGDATAGEPVGLDSLHLSWGCGCEGVVAARGLWLLIIIFFTIVTFISLIPYVGSSGLPFSMLLFCFPTFRVLWGLALLLLFTLFFMG